MYIKVVVLKSKKSLLHRRRERNRGKRGRKSEGERKREREKERRREKEFHLAYSIHFEQDLRLGYKHSCTERGGGRGRQKGGPKRFQKTFSDKTYHLVQQEYQF